MREYVLMTDSCCDLPDQMAKDLQLEVLPLTMHMDGQDYPNTLDGAAISNEEFYRRIRAGKMATTSAVNVAAYTEAVEPLLRAGKDVLILAFSSGLSTTCNSAEVAAEELREQYPQRKLYVVDTLCASLGQGLLVWLAAREQKKGRSIEEVRDWAEAHKQAVCHQFTVQDLKFLKRGGRITATTAVLGSMLQIKPLLHVDQEGKLTAVGKARGRHASLKALVDRMEKTVTDEGRETVFISHGDCRGDADKVAEMVRERFGTRDIQINYIGPVIGAHAGPGTLALFYLGSER